MLNYINMILGAHPINCCTDDGQLLPRAALHNQCYPIIIPANDPVFTDRQCNNFVRTITDLNRGCVSEIRQAEQVCIPFLFYND